MKTDSLLKIALVHDFLKEYGGAERVVEELYEIFPQAPVFTSFVDFDGLGTHHAKRFKDWEIQTSWIQNLPFAKKLISPLRIFTPLIFEKFDLSGFDLVISSTSVYFAKSVRVPKDALHLAYIHTPPRFLYGYNVASSYKKHFLTKVFGEIVGHFLRLYDFKVSQRPNVLIANSKNIQGRIKKFYRRESVVIYPPVDVERFKAYRVVGEGGYFLSVSRLVLGKGVELIIQACSELNLPLKVVGTGPLEAELKKIAGKSVEFLGPVPDSELPLIYASAGALVLASQDEDFGITPVEAMASGTPILALRAGGYLETVVERITGEFFEEATVESLKSALKKFDFTRYKYDDLIKQAEKFSKEHFKKQVLKLIADNLPT